MFSSLKRTFEHFKRNCLNESIAGVESKIATRHHDFRDSDFLSHIERTTVIKEVKSLEKKNGFS
jgi:hypothetical protein